MKFLNEEGKIVEGTPLTDEQVEQRERLIAHLHQTICKGRYHTSYDAMLCEILATDFVTGKLDDIAKVHAEVESEHPSPFPTGVEA